MKQPLLVRVADRVPDLPPLRAITVFLFHPRPPDESGRHSVRWTHAAALAAVTLLVALLARGELSGLLAGMHPAERPAATVADLSRAWDFRLSAKADAIAEAADTWSAYRDAVGLTFTSPRTIVGWYTAVTVLALIPAYVMLGAILILALIARATGVDGRGLMPTVDPAAATLRRTGGSALLVLAALGSVHIAERLLAYSLVAIAWNDGPVSIAGSTMLGILAISRSALVAMLAGLCLPLLAGRLVRVPGPATTVLMKPRHPDVGSMIALRAGALVIVLLIVACFVPVQMADVARRWTVSSALAAVVAASALAIAIEHHGRNVLRIRHRHLVAAGRGTPEAPRRVRFVGRQFSLGHTVLVALLTAAALQLALDLAGLGVGRGLLIPVALVGVVRLLGLPLEPAAFNRGTREPSAAIVAAGPRLLGAAVFVVLGAAVFRASVGHLAYSGRVDGYLALALVPPAIGAWWLAARKRERVGLTETTIAAALAGAAVVLAVRSNPQLTPSALLVTGVLLIFGAIPFYFSFGSPATTRWDGRTQSRVVLTGIWMGAVGLTGALIAQPLSLGPIVGAFAVTVLLALFALAALAMAVDFAEQTTTPRLLAALRVQRTPMIAALGAWLLFSPAFIDPGAHDIRLITDDSASAAEAGIGIEAVWDRYSASALSGVTSPPRGERLAMPLVLISSSGGGTRAATWTAYVLDCLFSVEPVAGDARVCPDPGAAWRGRARDSVAAVIGVSGGGLGLATFLLHGLEGPTEGDWVADRLGDDYLSAAVTWLAFVDLPRTVLGFSSAIPDRAEMLERAWESSWPGDIGLDAGIFEIWQKHPEVPVMIFSGSSVLDACRFNGSVLDVAVGAPGLPCSSLAPFSAGSPSIDDSFFTVSRDLTDFLCPGEDVRLSTAVLMAARFPVLSPMARVAGSGGCATGTPAYVVDGGYFEGSGAATVYDVFTALQSAIDRHNAASEICVVPFLIHIDNGYEGGRSPATTPPRELLAPFVALNAARTSRMNDVRAEAAWAFDSPLLVAGSQIEVVAVDPDGTEHPLTSRYARITTRTHPGVEAPLGWSLSRASIEDLRLQLQTAENTAELTEVFRWFNGTLECRTG